MRHVHALILFAFTAAAAACGAQSYDDVGSGGASADGDAGSGGDGGQGGSTGPSGSGGGGTGSGDGGGTVPAGQCAPPDVLALMQKSCETGGCHSANPSAPPLLSYADLTATSKVDPTKLVAERALARAKDKTSSMPPAGPLAAATIAPLEAWVTGGMKPIACGATDAGADSGASDEFNVPATCTNGQSSAGQGSTMDPGRACNGCHGFGIAGTVYPTAHEPNNCKGVAGSGAAAGAKVVVTDVNGKTSSITVNSAGNFVTNGGFAAPFSVKVVAANGHERQMATKLTAAMGDCNGCHTQAGSGSPKAPGRILMPK